MFEKGDIVRVKEKGFRDFGKEVSIVQTDFTNKFLLYQTSSGYWHTEGELELVETSGELATAERTLEPIRLSGINGIRNNLNAALLHAIEGIVERVIATPELQDVRSETIAELIHRAIIDFEQDISALVRYVDRCRQYAKEHPETQPSKKAPTDAGDGDADRDTMLRNQLFNRVQAVLEVAESFADPNELSADTNKTVNDFRLYRNLAEKQIQERDDALVSMSYNLESVAGELVSLQIELAEAFGLHRDAFLDADGKEDMHKRLAELATLRVQVAALTAALEPFAEDYRDWLADDHEETYLAFLERTRDHDNVAISAAIGYKLLHSEQTQNTPEKGGE